MLVNGAYGVYTDTPTYQVVSPLRQTIMQRLENVFVESLTTHWGLNKMADNMHATISNAFFKTNIL